MENVYGKRINTNDEAAENLLSLNVKGYKKCRHLIINTVRKLTGKGRRYCVEE